MSPSLESCPALVLNADYRPLSYYPLSLWSWQDTVKAVFLDRVTIHSEYEREVRAARMKIRLPSVIALKDYINTSRSPAFTRFNVFLRDSFTCQYCGGAHATHELTFDHVIPRAHGGRTGWENVVTACGLCNLKKGSKALKDCGLRLHRMPWRPTSFELQENGRSFPPFYLHESWRDYLYWDTVLDQG